MLKISGAMVLKGGGQGDREEEVPVSDGACGR